jgi:hypothetical protein
LGLAACSSDSGGGEYIDLDEIYDSGLVDLAMFDGNLTADGAVVPAAVLPQSGGATYIGLASVWATEGPSLIGGGEFRADFGARTIDGSLGSFVGPLADHDPATTAALDGELAVSGVIGTGEQAISATMAGELTGNGHVIGVDGTLTGDFWDEDGAFGESVDPNGMILTGETELTVDGVALSGGSRIVIN